MKLDNKMKQLLREMGEAINDSLSASDDLSGTIDRIRQAGYDIFLILEATIGLNPRSGAGREEGASRTLPAASIEITDGGAGAADEDPGVDGTSELVFQVSPDDEQFLRSLRISVDEAVAGPDENDTDTPTEDLDGDDGNDIDEQG